MNIRLLFLASMVSTLLVPGISASTPDTAASAKPAAGAPGAPASALKQGMRADAVRQLLGQPEEIRPMKAPNGKAEIWVFTRQISTRMERVGFPSGDIVTNTMGPDGKLRQQSTPGPTQYHDVHYITGETTELLMFNDHFVTQKVFRQEKQVYQ